MTNPLYMLMNYLNNAIKKDTNYYLALSLAQNITKLAGWSLERTAAECNVSVSTLNRFFKDMGFENFSGAKKYCSMMNIQKIFCLTMKENRILQMRSAELSQISTVSIPES